MTATNKAPDFGVKGQRVLITGGTGGIGMAFARAFAAAGATVVVTDLKEPKDKLPAGVSFASLDVRSDEQVAALAKTTEKLDVMIHCAGWLQRHEQFKIEFSRTR